MRLAAAFWTVAGMRLPALTDNTTRQRQGSNDCEAPVNNISRLRAEFVISLGTDRQKADTAGRVNLFA